MLTMFDKNMSVLYPLSEIDPYSVDTFCIAETFSCLYSIYTVDILARSAHLFHSTSLVTKKLFSSAVADQNDQGLCMNIKFSMKCMLKLTAKDMQQ